MFYFVQNDNQGPSDPYPTRPCGGAAIRWYYGIGTRYTMVSVYRVVSYRKRNGYDMRLVLCEECVCTGRRHWRLCLSSLEKGSPGG